MMGTQKQPYHHGNLRQVLIESAAKMIADNGLDNITMRGLGKKVGVSRSAPYRHFSSKQDLLCAIAGDGFKKMRSYFQKAISGKEDDIIEQFKSIGRAYIQFAVENPAYYRLMFGHEITEEQKTPELMASAASAFAELLNAIKTCQDQNLISKKDTVVLANIAWGAVHGMASLLIDGKIQTESASGGLLTLLYSGKTKKNAWRIENYKEFLEMMIQMIMKGLKEI
jgi:AcrR family transcriptional regulator